MTVNLPIYKNPPLLLPNPTIPLMRYSVVPHNGGAVVFPICPFVDRLCDQPALAQPDSARTSLPGDPDEPVQDHQREPDQLFGDSEAFGYHHSPALPFDRGHGLRRQWLLGCFLEAYRASCHSFYQCSHQDDYALCDYAKCFNPSLAPPADYFQ
jgi:hypothetical protein